MPSVPSTPPSVTGSEQLPGSLRPWQAALVDGLVSAQVTVAAFVPDSRLDAVLSGLAGRGVALRSLTREEECLSYAAGVRLAGGRPVVMLQSSGLGNALNALGTLVVPYRLGVPLIVSMRGTLGETNPSQIPIGRATVDLFTALAVQSFPVRHTEDVAHTTSAVLDMAYLAGESAAILLQPDLGGGRERP